MSRRLPAAPVPPTEGAAATRRPLVSAPGVSVFDFRCRAHVEPIGEEEANSTHSIVFVRRGVFARTGRDGTVLADPNQVLFFNRDEPYRFAHPLPGGDDCTVLALDDGPARRAAEHLAPGGGDDPRGPFRRGHAPSTPRAARLHFELLAACAGAGAAAPLAAEEIVGELIDESLAALRGAASRGATASTAVRRRRRETVEAAKLLLHRRLESPPALGELAAELGCSPFHLSRIFHAETGLRLRQYLRRLRVRLAAEHLGRGARDLTALALDLGFCDHSHFTTAFRREWGVPPSRLRPPKAD